MKISGFIVASNGMAFQLGFGFLASEGRHVKSKSAQPLVVVDAPIFFSSSFLADDARLVEISITRGLSDPCRLANDSISNFGAE